MQIKGTIKKNVLEQQDWRSARRDGRRQVDGIGGETARLFNSAIGAAVIAALDELGLFDELQQNKMVRVKAFCDKHDLHPASISTLLRTLDYLKIINLSPAGDIVCPGSEFADVYENKGYFLWLIRGYGHMWQNLSMIVKNEHRTGDFVQRNGKYIAMAGRDYGAQFVDSYFTDMLGQMPFRTAADIGCGSGERLINLAKAQPDFQGVGIEFNRDAAMLAQRSVAAANLQNRITVLHSDVKSLTSQPMLSQVEVIFSFFMAHDLWPRENCLQTLRHIRTVFPRVKRFLLCDTYRSDLSPSHEIPIFTLGFEVTHAVMGQYVPSIWEWLDLFAEAGWLCSEQQPIGIPFSCIFDLRPGNESKDNDDEFTN